VNQPGSADPEFARRIPAAFFADLQDNFATGTIGFFFQIAVITIRFIRIRIHFTDVTGNLIQPGFFPESFIACVTQGIETGLAFFFQRIAAPVQVGHDGVLPLILFT